jgi:hypothetical protein
MEGKEIVLINNTGGRNTVNFKGTFPQNKWTGKKGGKIYLTEREFEWLEINHPHALGKSWIVEGSGQKVEVEEKTDEERHAEFFKQHVNKAKSKIAKMESLDEINELIEYASFNEIDNKAVDTLIERANELGE